MSDSPGHGFDDHDGPDLRHQGLPHPERRRQQEPLWPSLLRWLSVIGWLLMAAVLILVHDARPEMNTGLVRYWGLDIRTHWRADLTAIIEVLLWCNAGLSLAAIVINRIRLRRKGDNRYYNLWLLGALSTALLLLFQNVAVG